MFGVGGVHAGDVHEIGDDCRRRRFGTGTLAIVERRADRIALDQDRVHRPLDVGDQPFGGDQGRMHAQFDALGGAFGDAEQLDAVAELFSVPDVGRVELADAFDVRLLEAHRVAESNRRHDAELVRGVHALDVEGRIGLGVAEALRFLEHRGKGQTLVAHLGENEVGGAVDDAGDPLDAVGGETFAQCLDDRDAASDGGLESDHHALFLSSGKNLVAVPGEQGLVGGDHVFAIGDRLQYEFPGDPVAADQLDDDVDLRVADHRKGVVGHPAVSTGELPDPFAVLVGNDTDLNGAAGAAGDFFSVTLENGVSTATDGADPEKSNVDRFHSAVTSKK
ncbi:MAG: hypothetical protein AW09_003140 [Candidatus Accumulibacter phosphatis]|uniref:Uncharacterized protein n=1 Tax=Candidatus Accumulibacter phosphatis TaxID=327160 RepID=A0A080LT99_9PROT|nr:MAG: hypothetical protein AW09_003140 [Candidatus Accumulibacter phosphatis]